MSFLNQEKLQEMVVSLDVCQQISVKFPESFEKTVFVWEKQKHGWKVVLRDEKTTDSEILPAPLAEEVFEQIPGRWTYFDPDKINAEKPAGQPQVTHDTEFTLSAEKDFNDEYDVSLKYRVSDDGKNGMTCGMSYNLVEKPMRNNLATAAIGAWVFVKMCQETSSQDYAEDQLPEESTKLVFSCQKWPNIVQEEIVWDSKAQRVSLEDEKGKVIKCCSAEDVDKIWDAYEKCDFGNWADEYYEPVLDGETWNLEFYGNDVCVRQIHGINGYPENWTNFQKFIKLCKRIAKKKD